jgi:hypothetical protein
VMKGQKGRMEDVRGRRAREKGMTSRWRELSYVVVVVVVLVTAPPSSTASSCGLGWCSAACVTITTCGFVICSSFFDRLVS